MVYRGETTTTPVTAVRGSTSSLCATASGFRLFWILHGIDDRDSEANRPYEEKRLRLTGRERESHAP